MNEWINEQMNKFMNERINEKIRGWNSTRLLALFSAFLAPRLWRFSDFPFSLEVITRRREPYPNARGFIYRRFPRKMSRGNFPLEKLEFEF